MTVREIVEAFAGLSALVVGDICLDRWCTYDPAEADVSRETGLVRTAVIETQSTPGGGGTVANNLAALGVGRVAMIGAIGSDGFGHELLHELRARNVGTDWIVVDPGRQTFTYTKLLNCRTGAEDLPRVDFITTKPLPAIVERVLIDSVRQVAGEFDAIFISDQAEHRSGGVVTSALREAMSDLAREHPSKLFWVDSRMRIETFRGMVLKPNEREVEEASNRLLGRVNLAAMRERTGAPAMFVTRGAAGAEVYTSFGAQFIPAQAVEKPVDICGAGDSFSAAAAMTLAVTGDAHCAAQMGNLAASITIMQRGTGTAGAAQMIALGELA